MSTPLQLPALAEAFLNEVSRKHHPKAGVLRKSDSWLQRIIGFFVKPFNPKFMSLYVTTIGHTIYVPDDFINNSNELGMIDILAHETQHIIDYVANPIGFTISYLFPQCLALLSLFAFGAFFNLWMLLWLLALVFLAPIPSAFRYKAELKGYRTSILLARMAQNYNDNDMQFLYAWIKSQMTSESYYFAWPFPNSIEDDLKDESFISEPRYVEIINFLEKHKLTH